MNAEEYSKRGDKYLQERNFDDAIADYTNVIELESDNPFAYYKRGMSYFNKTEYDLAIADFNEAIRLEPNKISSFYADRADAYYKKGNFEAVISDMEMAVKIDPNEKKYQIALKNIKSRVGGTDESLKKDIKVILICAIIGGIAGAIISAVTKDYSMALPFAIILGLWAGLGVGGNIVFILKLFKAGGFIFGWWDSVNPFGFNMFIVLVNSIFGIFIAGAGFIAFAIAGPIWPLIRILLKRSQLKKIS